MERLEKAKWKETLLYYLGRRRGYLVEGNSMLPGVESGETVIVNPYVKPEIGDMVLTKHPYKKKVKILKRLAGFSETGSLILIGDNPGESTDSRTFGAVPIESLIGKVICRLNRNDRRKSFSSEVLKP